MGKGSLEAGLQEVGGEGVKANCENPLMWNGAQICIGSLHGNVCGTGGARHEQARKTTVPMEGAVLLNERTLATTPCSYIKTSPVD